MDNQRKKTENKQGKAPLGVFDAVIIVGLIACVIAAGFAFAFKHDNGETTSQKGEKEEFAVTFECDGISQNYAQLLKDGDMFYLPDNSDFGTLSGNVTITPAVMYVQRSDGTYVRTYAPENGDDTKVDVSGTLMVTGTRDSRGILRIGSNYDAAPGSSFVIYSSNVSVQVTVTAIEKVSK